MKSLILNLLGGPGVSKSTFAHGVMYELKRKGIDAEFAAEYAKDLVHEESLKKLDNQIYIFGKQLHRIKRMLGKASVIVTDAPLLLSVVYGGSYSEHFKNLILEEHQRYNNINILLERVHPYNTQGRLQDETGSQAIHKEVISMLDGNKIPYHALKSNQESLAEVVKLVEEKLLD